MSVDTSRPAESTTDERPARNGVQVLQLVSDPMRWQILTLLQDAQLCTTHLQDRLGARQTLVSHHLRVLREAGLLLTEPCGRFTYYRLRPGAFDEIAALVADLAAAAHGAVTRQPC